MINSKCKICRRLGIKLFLKGERCFSPKCPMVKRPYPPGPKAKRRLPPLSEYGQQLREKQKLKYWYGLSERELKKIIKEMLAKKKIEGDLSQILIENLERRLDNVVFKLGFAFSKSQARQMISHGHFLVNGKIVNLPSYQVKKGDKISLKETAKKKGFYFNILNILKKHNPPSWLSLDKEKLEAEVLERPKPEPLPLEISSIIAYYSR